MSGPEKEANSSENDKSLPADVWMIRNCYEYQDEHDYCKSRPGRRYQNYVYGKPLDCSQWKKDFNNCMKYTYDKDYQAAREVIKSEEIRRHERLKAARANNIWEYRRTPPKDWNMPLEEIRKLHRESESDQREANMEDIEVKSRRCVIS